MDYISYDRFKELVPKETFDYVLNLLALFDHNFDFALEEDAVFYKSLLALNKVEDLKNTANAIGFGGDAYNGVTSTTASMKDLFNKYYNYLTPFENEMDYLTLSAEDIILHIEKFARKLKNENYDIKTYDYVTSISLFLNKLKSISESKRKKIIKGLETEIFEDCKISVINYYKKVCEIYLYLEQEKSNNPIINEMDDDDIKAYSYLLALYYYDNVARNVDIFDEKAEILSHLEKHGLTSEEIEKRLGVDLSKMDTKSSILVLKNDLNVDWVKLFQPEDMFVGNVFYNYVCEKNNVGLCFRNVFGEYGLTISDVLDYYDELKESMNNINANLVNEIYNNVLPDVDKVLKRLCKTYSYLNSNLELKENFSDLTKNDYLVLSLLISCYIEKNSLSEFLSSQGLTFDKVLEFLELPNKNELISLIDKENLNKSIIIHFNDLLFNGFLKGKTKGEIIPDQLYTNLTSSDYSKSVIINKMFYSINRKTLPGNFLNDYNNYLKNVNTNKLLEDRERVFKDVSIDVYNYLTVVYSYYCLFANMECLDEDKKQLAIIYAAMKYNKELEAFMKYNGITGDNIHTLFGPRFDYYKETHMDIKTIEEEFGKYIFDREPDKITVNSIFENAFKPELTNSVLLRKGLNEVGKKPEDFLNIENKIVESKETLKQQLKQQQIDAMFALCKNEETIECTKKVLKIYEYLKNNIKDNELLETDEDYKELAMLIISLDDYNDYSEYFAMFNITQEYVLSLIGLTKEDLDIIYSSECNKELILSFSDYFKMSGRVELDDYTKCYLFNSENNFVGKIIEGLNEDYDNVEKCVVNKSEREYSLREKLALLNKKEMLALEGEDYLSLATYGQELFEHSSIISESLQKLVLSDSTDSSIKCINDALDEVVEEKKEQVDLPLSKLLFTLEPTERIVRKYNLEKVSEIQIPIDEELGKLFEEIRQYEDVAISIRFLALKANKLVEELQSKYKGLSGITASSDYFVASEAQTKKETIIGRIKTTQTMLSLLAKEYYSIQIAIRNHFTTINALRVCKYGIVPAIICEVAMSKGNKTESESLDNVNAIMELWGEIASVNPKMVQQNLEKLKQAVKNLSSFGKLETEVTKYLDSFNEDTELLKTEELPEEGNLDYFTVNGEKIKYPDGTPYVVRIAYECGLKLDGENQKKLDELIEKYGVPTKEEIKQGTDEEYKRAATLSLIRRPKKTPEELEALRIQLENERKQ